MRLAPSSAEVRRLHSRILQETAGGSHSEQKQQQQQQQFGSLTSLSDISSDCPPDVVTSANDVVLRRESSDSDRTENTNSARKDNYLVRPASEIKAAIHRQNLWTGQSHITPTDNKTSLSSSFIDDSSKSAGVVMTQQLSEKDVTSGGLYQSFKLAKANGRAVYNDYVQYQGNGGVAGSNVPLPQRNGGGVENIYAIPQRGNSKKTAEQPANKASERNSFREETTV